MEDSTEKTWHEPQKASSQWTWKVAVVWAVAAAPLIGAAWATWW